VIEDATGVGTPGRVGRTTTDAPPLVGPLRALLNLLPVSRGEAVAAEILGSGDPTIAGQEFPLARRPLTYLADTGPGAFDGYASTLRIYVQGIEWHEVAGFYGQPADAHVFATREDDEQRTHVRFGDGVNGARLPAGADNVVADYRVGSGARVPPIGTLTAVLRPQPGLASIRNPIAPGGGADPDPPEHIRRYAPRSVLTFGRAVSGDDYETIAAQTPGVNRARAVWGWDAASQRTVVKVLVGDDEAAVVAALGALRAFADPNRAIVVALAAPVYVDVTLVLEVHPDYEPEAVRAAVGTALLDPLAPPFGTGVVRIGSVVYDSEIYDACLEVPGVVAVHGLAFRVPAAKQLLWRRKVPPGFDARHWPSPSGAGAALRLDRGERHAPGGESYYLLGSNGLHITAEVSRRGS
jgi:predicted phage baseplate assembly protein